MSLNRNIDAEASQILGAIAPENQYKALLIGNQGQGGEPVEITMNPTERLKNMKPIGWGRNMTTIFREDGTVEIYGMIPFKEKEDDE